MAEKLGWVGGVVTAGLVWATGMWDRGVRWPRRWVSVTNRGLRGFNLKLVVIRKHWWQELFSYLSVLDLLSGRVRGMRFETLPKDIEKHASVERAGDKERARLWETGGRDGWVEEDVAPGGDSVKLLLLPKPFSPDFRADWETHRTTYWEKENERRKLLRGIVRLRARQLARLEGGWLWWTGWRGRNTFSLARPTISSSSSGSSKKPDLVRSRASHGSHNSLSSKGSHGQLKREKRRDRTPPYVLPLFFLFFVLPLPPPSLTVRCDEKLTFRAFQRKGFLKSRSSNTPLTSRVLNAEAST